MQRMFVNRAEAGRTLIPLLRPYVDANHTIVLALPRGGVPVAYEVAHALRTPLDVFSVRKLAAPDQPEFALGAIASSGTVVVNPEARRLYKNVDAVLAPVMAAERIELERRERLYRRDRPALDVHDKIVIAIDDGAATGATMLAAVRALRNLGPAAIIVGLPVCAREAHRELTHEADRVACVAQPEPFIAVGRWYNEFDQTPDEQVCELLARNRTDESLQQRIADAHIGSR